MHIRSVAASVAVASFVFVAGESIAQAQVGGSWGWGTDTGAQSNP